MVGVLQSVTGDLGNLGMPIRNTAIPTVIILRTLSMIDVMSSPVQSEHAPVVKYCMSDDSACHGQLELTFGTERRSLVQQATAAQPSNVALAPSNARAGSHRYGSWYCVSSHMVSRRMEMRPSCT
ncbi:hypothetical protein C487_15754 [Natrinema pallidum DSM 3751]|uniref:Uncharacterized protein n=2 Tax=Natrinema pallidum TaxID=69527 RepID=L9YLT3_9EURY|nr:hypothetical protein C487_15754 [Natrinema pallidum DSM 3751]